MLSGINSVLFIIVHGVWFGVGMVLLPNKNTRGTMHGIGSDYCWHRLKLSSLFDCIFSNV
jgi:hypothetical protein